MLRRRSPSRSSSSARSSSCSSSSSRAGSPASAAASLCAAGRHGSGGCEGRAVKIAWERHGAGPPLLLIHGLGYARWGWEPVVEPLAALLRRDPLRQPRDRRERRAARAVHGAPSWPPTRCRCSTRRASSGRTWSARASAGWSRRSSRSPQPERVDRLVLACTTPGGPKAFPMPEQTVSCCEATQRRRPSASRSSWRTRSSRDPSSRRARRADPRAPPSRTAQDPPPGRRRRPRATSFDAHDRLGARRADARPARRRRTSSSTPRNAELLVELDPGCARSSSSRAAAICSSGRSRSGSSRVSRSSS